MRTRTFTFACTVLVASLALAGCGQDEMHHDTPSAGPAASSAGSTEGAGTEPNAADVMFATMMFPHHEQAVEMSDLVLAKDGISSAVTDLATQIKDAQGPEIATLQGWVDAWPDATEDMGHDGHGGMLEVGEMEALDAAKGSEAERLFLEGMILHHEGAIDMAKTEVNEGRDSAARELAQQVIDGQGSEITLMRELLQKK